MAIKSREPGSAFMRQFSPAVRSKRKLRSWREVGLGDNRDDSSDSDDEDSRLEERASAENASDIEHENGNTTSVGKNIDASSSKMANQSQIRAKSEPNQSHNSDERNAATEQSQNRVESEPNQNQSKKNLLSEPKQSRIGAKSKPKQKESVIRAKTESNRSQPTSVGERELSNSEFRKTDKAIVPPGSLKQSQIEAKIESALKPETATSPKALESKVCKEGIQGQIEAKTEPELYCEGEPPQIAITKFSTEGGIAEPLQRINKRGPQVSADKSEAERTANENRPENIVGIEGNSKSSASHFNDKSEPNRSQKEFERVYSQTKIGAKSKPKSTVFKAILEPNRSQIEARTESLEPKEKLFERQNRANNEAISKPNLGQYTPKLEPRNNIKLSLVELSPLQLRCLSYVFRSCQLEGSKICEPISSSSLSEALKTTPAAVKKALQRLEGNSIIIREKFKRGRAGWTIYRIPDEIYEKLTVKMMKDESKLNQSQNRVIPEPQTEPQIEPSSSSSSSFINNNNTKTTTKDSDPILEEWAEIDVSPLADCNCFFSKVQFRQLRSLGLSPEGIQECIYHFGYALSQGWSPAGGFKSGPLNFFMGTIRNYGVFEFEPYLKARAQRTKREAEWLDSCKSRQEMFNNGPEESTKPDEPMSTTSW